MRNISRLACGGLTMAMIGSVCIGDGLWRPADPAPAMGHSQTPSTVSVFNNTQNFTITGTATDLDTFQRTVLPNDYKELAGEEDDIIVEKDFNPSSTNPSFNATTGERKRDYTFNGPFNLLSQGQVDIKYLHTRGVDSFDVTVPERHDSTTSWGQTQVSYYYVPVPDPGGG